MPRVPPCPQPPARGPQATACGNPNLARSLLEGARRSPGMTSSPTSGNNSPRSPRRAPPCARAVLPPTLATPRYMTGMWNPSFQTAGSLLCSWIGPVRPRFDVFCACGLVVRIRHTSASRVARASLAAQASESGQGTVVLWWWRASSRLFASRPVRRACTREHRRLVEFPLSNVPVLTYPRRQRPLPSPRGLSRPGPDPPRDERAVEIHAVATRRE